MRNKKRPQYVEEIVKKANERFRTFKIQEESNDLFVFVCDYLIKKKMYQGFNYFKDYHVIGTDLIVPTESGSYKKGEYEYLQIY